MTDANNIYLTFYVALAKTIFVDMAGVAQLVRAPVCGTGGRGFETRHSPHKTLTMNIFNALRITLLEHNLLIMLQAMVTVLSCVRLIAE